MSKFSGRLQLDYGDWTDVGAGRIAITMAPMYYGDFLIPPGTMSDGASTPRLIWSLLPPWGTVVTWPAILHDLLCRLIDEWHPASIAATRRDADRVFREALIDVGVKSWLAWICWAVVRVGSLIHRLGLDRRAATGPRG